MVGFCDFDRVGIAPVSKKWLLSDFPGIKNLNGLNDLNDLNNLSGLNDLDSLFSSKNLGNLMFSSTLALK